MSPAMMRRAGPVHSEFILSRGDVVNPPACSDVYVSRALYLSLHTSVPEKLSLVGMLLEKENSFPPHFHSFLVFLRYIMFSLIPISRFTCRISGSKTGCHGVRLFTVT